PPDREGVSPGRLANVALTEGLALSAEPALKPSRAAPVAAEPSTSDEEVSWSATMPALSVVVRRWCGVAGDEEEVCDWDSGVLPYRVTTGVHRVRGDRLRAGKGKPSVVPRLADAPPCRK